MTEEEQLVARLAKEYTTPNGDVFDSIKTWFPDSENDLWIEYQNQKTKQKYTCRLAAFLTRFQPHVNS